MILLYYLTIMALTLDLALCYLGTVFENMYACLGLAAAHLIAGRVFVIVMQWKSLRANAGGSFLAVLFDKGVRAFLILHLAHILFVFLRIVMYLVLDNGVEASVAQGIELANVILAWVDFAAVLVETPVFYYVFMLQVIKQLYSADD